MNNNTDDITSNESDAPQVTFIKWPLDIDDDEFRAGYPFSPVTSEEMNEPEAWCDVSSTSDDDALQSVNSQNNNFDETTKEDDKFSRSSCVEQEEIMESGVESSTVHDNSNGYNTNINKKEDHEEHKQDEYNQHSMVQSDYVDDNQANQDQSAK